MERRADQQHGGDRRPDRHENGDQHPVQHRAGFEGAEVNDRAGENQRGAERRTHGRRVHALIEGAQAKQPDRADEGEERAGEDQQRGDGFAHSITSPRRRNLASAAVETKPSMPITSAASKYSVVPWRMPSASTSSMPFT